MKTRFIPFLLLLMLAACARIHAADALAVSISLAPAEGGGVPVLGSTTSFHVIVSNVSDKPQRIWQDWCSWGYYNISFIFTDAGGKKYAINKGTYEWTKNSPQWWTLEPDGSAVFDVNFSDPGMMGRLWQGLPKPDQIPLKGTLEAVFEIPKEDFGRARDTYQIWTGRIVSKPLPVVWDVAAPAPKSTASKKS